MKRLTLLLAATLANNSVVFAEPSGLPFTRDLNPPVACWIKNQKVSPYKIVDKMSDKEYDALVKKILAKKAAAEKSKSCPAFTDLEEIVHRQIMFSSHFIPRTLQVKSGGSKATVQNPGFSAARLTQKEIQKELKEKFKNICRSKDCKVLEFQSPSEHEFKDLVQKAFAARRGSTTKGDPVSQGVQHTQGNP